MNIELHNVDCFEFMKSMPDKSVDCVVTDPPYGTTAIEWDKPINLVSFWAEAERITKDNAAILVFSSQPFTTDLIVSNRKLFRYEIVWKKTMSSNFMNANKMPLRSHENICVFYKKQPVYNPIKTKYTSDKFGKTRRQSKNRSKQYPGIGCSNYTDSGYRFPTDVIEFSNGNGAIFGRKDSAYVSHPTKKPVDLCAYLVNTYTNPGDLVFDPFFGSGTTAVACVQTGRNFIGCEIDPGYFSIAQKRVHDAQQQPSLLNLVEVTE